MYVVHGGLTNVSAFGIDPVSGELRLLNRQPCSGSNQVDAALDSSNRFLVVANHSSGSVAVLPLDTDGSLQPASRHARSRSDAAEFIASACGDLRSVAAVRDRA